MSTPSLPTPSVALAHPGSNQPGAQIVDLGHYRLLRSLGNIQGGMDAVRYGVGELSSVCLQFDAHLDSVHLNLSVLANSLDAARDRLHETAEFCQACLDACDLDDLDAMIRRRDELMAWMAAQAD
ncbi:MAG TPA: hypothetical protein VEB64_03525 [Azospirillaceae bacterium]|nr:hypothetical protein [Azospirillaceae bacterium]